jgi:hypothetical protein
VSFFLLLSTFILLSLSVFAAGPSGVLTSRRAASDVSADLDPNSRFREEAPRVIAGTDNFGRDAGTRGIWDES